MELGTVVLSIIVGGLILFFWTGFAQNVLPWGVKSVHNHHQSDQVGESLAGVTTNGMVYVKGRVAAFIAIKPEAYYSMVRYFSIELVTQFNVAAAITALLALTVDLTDAERLAVVGVAAVAGIASIDLQYWNWWGFSSWYSVGVAVNRLVGYLIAAFVLINWVV